MRKALGFRPHSSLDNEARVREALWPTRPAARNSFRAVPRRLRLYVVRTLALVETAKIPRGESPWRIELILLVAMSTCVLFGFLLTRLVVGTDVGATDALSGAALLLVSADAFWLASTLSQAESKMPERDSIPSVADTLWLAETFGLTPRETEIAALLCENRSVPYIYERLGLATSTTKTHVSRIYEEAGVRSRDALQLLATSRGDRGDVPRRE